MKPTKILLVAILTLIAHSSVRAEELKVMWKYTSPDDIIDVGLRGGETTVITKKEIIFLNKAGEAETVYPLGENPFAAISDNGSTIAVITHRPNIKELIEKTELFAASALSSYSSSSSCGSPRGEAEGVTPMSLKIIPIETSGLIGTKAAGSSPLCAIKENGMPYLSPDGTWLAIADKAQNKITFYDSAGKVLEKHTFFDIKNLNLVFSRDSGYCAVNIPNIQEGQTSGFIVLFDRKGKQLWKFDHPGSTIGALAVSENADNIIFSSENEMISINQKGKQNWKQPLTAGGIHIAVSENGEYLALCRREDNSVSLYNAGDGALLWKKKLGGLLGYNSPFTSLEVLNDGAIITTIAKSWSVKNDKSFLYIINGAQITSQEYEEPWVKAKSSVGGIVLYSKKIVMSNEL